jgi:hypothetical protein
MLSWTSLWHSAIQLEYEFKNDDRDADDWHMPYVRVTTNIARWIQLNTGAFSATKTWALTWLSDNPPPLRLSIETLQNALKTDGLQYEETIKQSEPLLSKEKYPPQKMLSPDTNAFVRDCIKAYAS